MTWSLAEIKHIFRNNFTLKEPFAREKFGVQNCFLIKKKKSFYLYNVFYEKCDIHPVGKFHSIFLGSYVKTLVDSQIVYIGYIKLRNCI